MNIWNIIDSQAKTTIKYETYLIYNYCILRLPRNHNITYILVPHPHHHHADFTYIFYKRFTLNINHLYFSIKSHNHRLMWDTCSANNDELNCWRIVLTFKTFIEYNNIINIGLKLFFPSSSFKLITLYCCYSISFPIILKSFI